MTLEHEFIPIRYGGFWDVPSAFFTVYKDELFLFWRDYFDDDLDDFPPNYEIYKLNEISMDEVVQSGQWEPSAFENREFIGEIPTCSVIFDETKRRFVNTRVFESLGCAG